MENLPNEFSNIGPRFFGLKNKFFYTLGFVLFLIIFYFLFLSAPKDFPTGSIIEVERGSSLRGVSLVLKEENIIRSRVLFEFFAILFGGEKHIVSTNYFFENTLPVYSVARRIVKGEHGMSPLSVTIPEGFDLKQIADAFTSKLPNFNRAEFFLNAKEGYLFPDTYFFLNDDTEKDVIKLMTDNFNRKVNSLSEEIKASKKSKEEIIIMASIIEREAKGDTDRGVIAGILWRRLAIGMPLQVDAALETYKVRGLPKNPISSPGLEAIKAAIAPTSSPYLYYLHDKTGAIHYAKTYAEHNRNIAKYLR